MEAGMAKKDLADMRAERDARRQRTAEKASRAAFRVISEESDGSEEEMNLLIAEVAKKFIESALHPFWLAVWKYDRKKTSGRYTVSNEPERRKPRLGDVHTCNT